MLSAVDRVECTNCDSVDLVALAALLIAVVALGVTFWQSKMAAEQHREFLRRIGPVALRVVVSGARFEGRVVRSWNANLDVLIRIEVKNDSDRAAEDVVVSLLTPLGATVAWSDANGNTLSQGEPLPSKGEALNLQPVESRGPPLKSSRNASVAAQYLQARLPRVSRRGANLYALVGMSRDAPTPLFVKVESDDLAEGESVTTAIEFSVANP